MVEFSNQLGQIAARMNALIKSSEAAIHHDLLAGALWWSDERPAFDEPEHHWCLRPILRYRTSLILGVPDERYESAWEAAKQLFPAWPGFAEERCKPDDQLATLYRKKHRHGLLSFGLVDILYRIQTEFKSRIPPEPLRSGHIAGSGRISRPGNCMTFFAATPVEPEGASRRTVGMSSETRSPNRLERIGRRLPKRVCYRG